MNPTSSQTATTPAISPPFQLLLIMSVMFLLAVLATDLHSRWRELGMDMFNETKCVNPY